MLKIIPTLALLICIFFSPRAHGLEIQKVVSPGGITAWLIEDHNLPLIATSFAFEKNPDPKNYSGTSAMLAALLDEGAGELNSQAFQKKLETLSIKMRFGADHDAIYGSQLTLTKNKQQAFELLALALAQPKLASTEIEKIRNQLLTLAQARQQNLSSVARELWFQRALTPHPYAFPTDGLAKDIKKIKRATLLRLHKKVITRANLSISVVGDITPEELAVLLDKVFFPLPQGKKLTKPKKKLTLKKYKKPISLKRSSPQTIIYFGLKGLRRDHPSFIPYYVMNHILGSGNSSRLYKIARQRLGLVYFIYSSPVAKRGGGVILGSAATRNHQKTKLLGVMRDIFTQMRTRGISEKELARAKANIIGSYGLGFDTSLAIAKNLTSIQRNQLGIDYIKRRQDLIEAVSVKQINLLIKRMLNYDNMVIITAGGSK